MDAEARHDWIENYIEDKPGGVDILDAAFVQAYIDATDANYTPTMWGAHKCVRLSRDLAQMHRDGMLIRSRVNLGSAWVDGYPRSLWHYDIPEHHRG